jgi:hypothetical protein
MRTHQRGEYLVVEWPDRPEEFLLGELDGAYPDLVEGRFVVISTSDSALHLPTAAQLAHGWRSSNNLAFSPRVRTWKEITHGRI